jgi:hypothetical protein
MAFMFRLEHGHGSAADPPTLKSAVPDWHPGDTIPLGGKDAAVVAVRDDDADQTPALVVEDVPVRKRRVAAFAGPNPARRSC